MISDVFWWYLMGDHMWYQMTSDVLYEHVWTMMNQDESRWYILIDGDKLMIHWNMLDTSWHILTYLDITVPRSWRSPSAGAGGPQASISGCAPETPLMTHRLERTLGARWGCWSLLGMSFDSLMILNVLGGTMWCLSCEFKVFLISHHLFSYPISKKTLLDLRPEDSKYLQNASYRVKNTGFYSFTTFLWKGAFCRHFWALGSSHATTGEAKTGGLQMLQGEATTGKPPGEKWEMGNCAGESRYLQNASYRLKTQDFIRLPHIFVEGCILYTTTTGHFPDSSVPLLSTSAVSFWASWAGFPPGSASGAQTPKYVWYIVISHEHPRSPNNI